MRSFSSSCRLRTAPCSSRCWRSAACRACCHCVPGAISGVYNKQTEAAVKQLQKYWGPYLGGLTYDGIVGNNTKKALRHPLMD